MSLYTASLLKTVDSESWNAFRPLALERPSTVHHHVATVPLPAPVGADSHPVAPKRNRIPRRNSVTLTQEGQYDTRCEEYGKLRTFVLNRRSQLKLPRCRAAALVAWLPLSLLPVSCSTTADGVSLFPGVASSDGWWHVFGDGTLEGWEPVDDGPGAVFENGTDVVLTATKELNAMRWGGGLPTVPYEIQLEASRLDGNDIFCGLTFPVGEASISLILGGWSGQICGLSSLNYYDASDNETTTFYEFENERWYRVRLVVQSDSITAWLDDEPLVFVRTEGQILDTRLEMDGCKPLGLATWMTRGGFRNMRIRHLSDADDGDS